LIRVGLKPADRCRSDKVASACTMIDLRMLDPWRRNLLCGGPRCLDDASPRASDHQIADRKMLKSMIDDRSHAFRHGLILKMDAIDPGIAGSALQAAIDHVVIPGVGGEPPAPVPSRVVGQCGATHSGARNGGAVLHLAQPGSVSLPGEMHKH